MSLSDIIFYLLGAAILGAAWMAVNTARIFRAAIWLLASLIGVAGLFFWMEMEFIAAVQIVVYAGGIVVLIIFSIFLTQRSGEDMPTVPAPRRWAALLAALTGAGFTAWLIHNHGFEAGAKPFDNEVARIGHRMLDLGEEGYVLPFELISILLLAALVGSIVIAMRDRNREASAPAPENQLQSQPQPEEETA